MVKLEWKYGITFDETHDLAKTSGIHEKCMCLLNNLNYCVMWQVCGICFQALFVLFLCLDLFVYLKAKRHQKHFNFKYKSQEEITHVLYVLFFVLFPELNRQTISLLQVRNVLFRGNKFVSILNFSIEQILKVYDIIRRRHTS